MRRCAAVFATLLLASALRPAIVNAALLPLTDGSVVRGDLPPSAFSRVSPAPRIARAQNGATLVIVTDAALVPAFTPLALAHTSLGLPTTIHTLQEIQAAYPVAADDAERIRFFLRDAYALGARFVLMGGDEPLIPIRRIVVGLNGTDHLLATDQYYGCLNGSWDGDHDGLWGEWRDANPGDTSDDVDFAPQLAVGRAPVTTAAEAQTFVEKTLDALGSQAGAPLASALLAAGTIPISPMTTIDLAPGAEQLLPVLNGDPGTSFTRLYENQAAWPGSLLETPASLLAALADGHDLAVLFGQGGSGVFVAGSENPGDFVYASDLTALANPHPLHTVFMSAFTTAPGTASIGAALMRDPNGGAVTVLGPTEGEFISISNTFMRQVLEQAYQAGAHTIGEALQNAILPYASGYVSEFTRFTTEGNLLLGDPALAFPGTAPGGPTAVEVSLVSADAGPQGVRVVWSLTGGAAVTVERRTEATAWAAIASRTPDGMGRIAFADPDVIADTRYGYRLSFVEQGTTRTAGETWIDVPRPALALPGLTPNPSTTGFRVAFRLANSAPATLEVFDVRGRRVVQQDVGGLAVGDHTVDLTHDAVFAPGLYWLRLTQNGEVRTARGAVVR